jgi:protein gp37
MATTSIEWTRGDDGTPGQTWNPTVGCTKVSPGCKHCYAETMHARLTAMGQKKYAKPFRVVHPWADDLDAPLHWRKPRRVFVNSMSDLFHEDVPDEYIAAVFGVMAAAPQHTFQVLTKRAERMARWVRWLEGTAQAEASADAGHQWWRVWECLRAAKEILGDELRGAGTQSWPLPNVWIGVSVENQQYADGRIPHLLSVPAAVRFLSCEPLLAPVDLTKLRDDEVGARWNALEMGIGWVIVGGESGNGARPCALEWIGRIAEQCRGAGVPAFVKQLGACVVSEERTAPVETMAALCGATVKDYDGYRSPSGEVWAWRAGLRDKKGGDPSEWPDDLRVRQYPGVRP